MAANQKLKKCIRCGKTIKSLSPMRKYCFECRIEMRKVWFENFKKRRKKQLKSRQ